MDTSDSECFESADESLQSDDDDENTNSVIIASKVETLKLEERGNVEVKQEKGRKTSDRKVEETKEEECLLERGSKVGAGKVEETKEEVRKETKPKKDTECLLEKKSEVGVVCDRKVEGTQQKVRKVTTEEARKETKQKKDTECLLEKKSEVGVVCDRKVEGTQQEVRKETKQKKDTECLLEKKSEVGVVCDRKFEGTQQEVRKVTTEEARKETKQKKDTECLLEKKSEVGVVCDRKVEGTQQEVRKVTTEEARKETTEEVRKETKKEVRKATTEEAKQKKETECLLESGSKDGLESDRKLEETKAKEGKQTETTLEKEKVGVATEETKEDDNLWADDEGWGNLDNIEEEDPTIYDNTQLPADLKKGKLVSKYLPDEDKWEFDTWEPVNEDKTTQIEDNSTSSWGGWGNWGVNSILSTATTLTTQVSQGLSNAMGVPDPEQLARLHRLDPVDNTGSDNNNPLSFRLGNLVSGVSHLTKITKIVESTSTKVINSGLDTLESIGKKTMEVLQDGDPGLKKKRAFLNMNQEKPVLSQILREAKQKAEEENKVLEEKHFARKANYESIFDDCQGLVHLEALEMLSKQCDIKLQTVLETSSGESLKEVQETLEQVKELCEILDEDEDEETGSGAELEKRLEGAVSEIGINITYEKLLSTWRETEEWLGKLNLNVCSARELHQQAIETLAQLTATAVEQFHKGGELLLVKEHRSTADEADSLVQLTATLTALIGVVAAKFSDKLNSLTATSENKEEINGLITNIFLEAANSSSYIQDAFQLLIPVLQVGAI